MGGCNRVLYTHTHTQTGVGAIGVQFSCTLFYYVLYGNNVFDLIWGKFHVFTLGRRDSKMNTSPPARSGGPPLRPPLRHTRAVYLFVFTGDTTTIYGRGIYRVNETYKTIILRRSIPWVYVGTVSYRYWHPMQWYLYPLPPPGGIDPPSWETTPSPPPAQCNFSCF